MAVGDTQVAGIGDQCRADASGPGFGGGVGELAAQAAARGKIDAFVKLVGGFAARVGERGQAGGGGEDIVANALVAGLEIAAISVDDELVAQRHIDRAANRTFIRCRAVGGEHIDVGGFIRDDARDALVDHVDHAADCRRAVKQRGRAAQDFDALGEQRVDHDRMIGAGVRYVERADAVGEDAHAFALKAAQDRARGVGTERGGRDAGCTVERFTQRGAQGLSQFLALNHRDARDDVLTVAGERGRNDDLVGRLGVRVLIGRGVFCKSRRGQRESGAACEEDEELHLVAIPCGVSPPIIRFME